jgi:bifunctional N-acetylglucosamine-1-phosphate-uridyltransferase/glucosamine-1-phosphate-acetyltransferase GlmU-like protein
VSAGWNAVIAALDDDREFRSRVSVYLHPLAGRPVLWHVVRSLLDVTPAPESITILHHADVRLALGDEFPDLRFVSVARGEEALSLRAGVTSPGTKVLVDGAAPLLLPSTIARLLRAGEGGIATLPDERGRDHERRVAVAGEGPALASAADPRHPAGAGRVSATNDVELHRITDRHSLSVAACELRDRLVRQHEANGVTFLLPATVWLDVPVRIGADSLVYPGVVIEGATTIGGECVIGPHSRIVESTIGRGTELKGWNYVARTNVRNHAVLEPYERRGRD